MTTVNVHDAKTHPSRLINRVESGDEIIISRAGKPGASIVPLTSQTKKRMLGIAKGRILIVKCFFEPLPEEVLKDFEH
jgi:prevent-host-death family protein